MSSLKQLLRDADPLRHEDLPLETARVRVRHAMLGAISTAQPTRPRRERLMRAAAVAAIVIAVAALAYQVWMRGTTPVLAAVRFEVRLAEEKPLPGLIVANVADSDRIIFLHPEIVVGNDDIAQSWVSQDGPAQFAVAVQFLPSGAERLREATTNHVGRPMAILVDGGVVMAPVVRSPIRDSAMITGSYTRAQAERIADGISRH